IKRVVFVKQGSGSIINPVDSNIYLASSDWNIHGTQLDTSGYYCVYNGTGNSVTLTNLNPVTQYTVQVFEYNYNKLLGNRIVYLKSTAINNPNQITTLKREQIIFFDPII